MIAVDLAAAAQDEARRLTGARSLIGVSRPIVADGPLVGIARRRRLRTALRRRILLVYRCAYEDATGRLVHSRLVAMTVAVWRPGPDLRRAHWSEPSLLARIDDECRDWRDAAQRVTREFALARRSRERAIAANHTAVPRSFQPGLFDRRADRAHTAHEHHAADLAAQRAARLAAVEAACTLTLRATELLLVLIPRDAARV
jgi:hypothetical protein